MKHVERISIKELLHPIVQIMNSNSIMYESLKDFRRSNYYKGYADGVQKISTCFGEDPITVAKIAEEAFNVRFNSKE